MLKAMLITATVFGAGAAYADEVIIHRDAPPPPPTSSSTTVTTNRSNTDCSSRTVHRSDGAGDSSTTRTTNCN